MRERAHAARDRYPESSRAPEVDDAPEAADAPIEAMEWQDSIGNAALANAPDPTGLVRYGEYRTAASSDIDAFRELTLAEYLDDADLAEEEEEAEEEEAAEGEDLAEEEMDAGSVGLDYTAQINDASELGDASALAERDTEESRYAPSTDEAADDSLTTAVAADAETSLDGEDQAEALAAEAAGESSEDEETLAYAEASTEPVEADGYLEQTVVTETSTAAGEPEPEASEETSAPPVELATWRAEVSAASAEIPQPELESPVSGVRVVRVSGGSMREARAAGRAYIPREARAAVTPAPEVAEPLPPPEPDPVPAATQRVEEKSNRRLPDQRMPDLQPSPAGTQPRLGDRPVVEPPATTEPAVAPIEEGAEADPDREHAEEVARTAEEPAPEEEREAQTEGVTLTDEPPEPSPPLPTAAKSVIASILARLLANPEQSATRIIEDARKAAYPEERLQLVFPEVGNTELAGLTESVTSELRAVAVEAGIARDELDEAVTARNRELEAERARAEADISTATVEEGAALETSGTEEAALVAGAREQLDEYNAGLVEAASGEADPAVVNATRDRLRERIDRTVGQQRVAYAQARDGRKTQLDAAMREQVLAYQAAGQRDERTIRDAHVGEEPLSVAVMLEISAVGLWVGARERELRRNVFQLKRDAETTAQQYTTELGDAGDQARDLIEAWAEERLGVQRSWWEQLWAMFDSWNEEARAESAAWETARAGETRTAILTDFVLLNQFAERAGESVDLESEGALAGLSEEQQAVIRAYYSTGPDARNPITAVAAGLQIRLSLQRRPQLIQRFETELRDMPDSEWRNLDLLGKAERADFSADRLRQELRTAMFGGVTGWGTDEARIFAALASLSTVQGLAVRKCYSNTHDGDNLEEDLESELSGAEETRALAQLSGNQTLADVATLYEAMHGGITGWGTDEDAIMRTLRGKPEEERMRIIEEYRRQYDVDLSSDLNSELGDHELERAEALMEGDTARADAIAIDEAMRGGWTGWGTDEAAIEAVYAEVRREVAAEAAQRGWTTAQMEDEIRRRNLGIESSYNARYGADWTDSEDSALRQAYASELSGPELDLANALADNDLIAADAARIRVEAESFWYTDDDVVNGVLRNQYERALSELRRDEWPEIQRDLDRRAREEGWDQYQRRAAEREAERALELRAQERSRGYMSELEDTYDSSYQTWYGDGLRGVIEINTSGYDREMARDLIAQGGRLTPVQELHYAVSGVGTDESTIRRTLAGRSADEIAEFRTEWLRLHPGESLDARLDDELGGRDEFDTRMLLRGEPANAAEEFDQMRDRAQWEFDNASGFLAGEQERILRERLETLEADYATLHSPAASPRDRELASLRFQQSSGNVSTAIEGYREQMDAAADAVATAAAIAAAVIVVVIAAVLTPFTGGGSAAAGAGILAALGGALTSGAVAAAAAIAAATATIVAKQLMLGDAYSGEDMALDVVVGAVDAVAAYATAGIGAGLLKAARAGNLARMAASTSRFSRIAAHGIAEGVEGLVGSLPAAIVGNAGRDENWERGNPLVNILGGVAVEVGIGTFVSAGLGSLSGIRHAPTPDARPPGDLLAHRGTPQQRLSEWRAYRAEHPDADMGTWLRQFDEGVAQRLARGEAADRAQRVMRGQLLSGIPPAQRRQFANVSIDVLSDADFTRLTRSSSGTAVVIFERGRPRVLLREGADMRVLREEGIHLLQSVDPRTRRLVRRLDERRLADWDTLDLNEQFSLYRNKINLEVDAQQRLLRGLNRELMEAGDDAAARRLIGDQMESARRTLDNLNRRLDEVDSITPRERDAMSRGTQPRPQYLDQPARLFGKRPPPPDVPVVRRRPPKGVAPAAELPQSQTRTHGVVTGKGARRSADVAAEEAATAARRAEGEPNIPPERAPRVPDEPRAEDPAAPRAEGEPAVRAEVGAGLAEPRPLPRNADELRARRDVVEDDLADSRRDLAYRADRLDDLEDAATDWSSYRGTKGFNYGSEGFPPALQRELAALRRDVPNIERNIADLEREVRDINSAIEDTTGFRPGAEADYAALSYDRLGSLDTPICFAAGTPVHTAQGLRPIERLREGDFVRCFNDRSGTIEMQPVTAVLRGWTNLVVEITAAGERIRSTRNHRFFVEHSGWQQARVLDDGMRLHAIDTSHDVQAATTCAATCDTFNLEVAENHNYFVGAAGFLVHNGVDSGFASTEVSNARIYVVVDRSQMVMIDGVLRPRVIYCGRTTQGAEGDVVTRFRGHLRDKPHWRERNLTVMPVDEYLRLTRPIQGDWTVFESAVWEQHFIALFGGKAGEHRANRYQAELENTVNAITPAQFNAHRLGHNACR